MEDPTDLTDELEDFVHKINQINKSRLMGMKLLRNQFAITPNSMLQFKPC